MHKSYKSGVCRDTSLPTVAMNIEERDVDYTDQSTTDVLLLGGLDVKKTTTEDVQEAMDRWEKGPNEDPTALQQL